MIKTQKRNTAKYNPLFRKHSSLKSHWFISYLLVLTLPLLISTFFYVRTIYKMHEANMYAQKQILHLANEQLKSLIYDTTTLTDTLLLNKNIQTLSNQSAIDMPIGKATLMRYYLSQELNQLKSPNNLFNDIIIYFPATNYVVNTNNAIPVRHLSSPLLNYDNLSTLCNILTENDYPYLLIGEKDFLYLIKPLYVTNNKRNQSCSYLLININKHTLINRMGENFLPSSESSLALISEQNVLLSVGAGMIIESTDASTLWHYYAENQESDYYNHEHTFNGHSYIINYLPSAFHGIALVFIIEQKEHYSTIHQMLDLLFLLLASCLLLGIGIILFLSRINYRPVKQLMQYIDINNTNSLIRNEYQLIENHLKSSQDELKQHRAVQYNNYLAKVLTGELPFNQISAEVRLNFSSSESCVLGIQPKNDTPSQCFSLKDKQLFPFIIENILGEMLTSAFPEHYFCTFPNHIIYVLINMPNNNREHNDLLQTITDTVKILQNYLLNNFQLETLTGIGNIKNNETISESWLQSKNALEYVRLFGKETLKTYKDIPLYSGITNIPIHTCEYVQTLLLNNSDEQLDKYFSDIYIQLKKQTLSFVDAKTCLYFFYITTAELYRYCQIHYNFTPTSLNIFDNDAFFSAPILPTISVIHSSYRNFMAELAVYCQKTEPNIWGIDICHYIENNYFDMNLNLNSIAEHFSLTPSYLSQKFKKNFGKSVNDYLYEIRIVHAKQLLTDSNLKIAEISQLTGFVDSNAFIRIFKKYVGTTPRKYSPTDIIDEFGNDNLSSTS